MDLWPFVIAFLIIGAAELGDKTQLLVLCFAAKYPFWKVIAAVFAAASVLMAIAVMLGSAFYRFLPPLYIQISAGVIFILFGLWTLFGKDEDEEDDNGKGKNPFWIVFSAFFIAELGDKTQLATLTLSAEYGTPLLVWLGATLGMMVADTVAVIAGSWIRKYVSEKQLKLISAFVFIIFGVVTLIDILI